MATSKFEHYLYSRRNILGCVLALIGLYLFFTGVIHAYWALIVGALYAAGALVWPPEKPVVDRAAAIPASADIRPEQLATQMRSLLDSVSRRVPGETVSTIRNIQGILEELLPRLEQLQSRGVISSRDAFTVTETVRRYLPDTLRAYLQLPARYAQSQPLADGKTATQTLLGQLTTLEGSLREISANAFEGDAQTLIRNGQFLQARFAEKAAFRP